MMVGECVSTRVRKCALQRLTKLHLLPTPSWTVRGCDVMQAGGGVCVCEWVRGVVAGCVVLMLVCS